MSVIEYQIVGKLKNYRAVLFTIGYYGIITVLLFSGVSKILDANPLMEVLKQINLPTDLAIGIAALLPKTKCLGAILQLRLN